MKKTVSIFMLFALALVSTTVWAESLSERIRASKNNVTKEVNVALLTIYDMCKAMDRAMEIFDVHLEKKDGGKSGLFERSKEREQC